MLRRGLYNDGTATITNSTISDNTSSGSGGGITNHEVFAFTLQNTSPTNATGALISNVTVFINPTRYLCTLAVKGAQAISGNFESNGV